MKLFDTFCSIIEKWLPENVLMINEAKLFEIPGFFDDIIPDKFCCEFNSFKENFILPFSNVIIEDRAQCVFLADLKLDNVGLNAL